ncbi:hypothetical protein BH11CYA1_BH11CYA1_17540 [soil metagenome]
MSDHLRPSFQAENFRGNEVNPIREAACQAYAPENQAVFRIDIHSSKGTESLPGLQIVFEQDGSSGRGNSGRDGHRDFSPPAYDFSRGSSHESSRESSNNPWHHGHEQHSHSHHRMSDAASNNFLGNDRTSNISQSSRFDRQFTNDNNFVSTDSPPWESQNNFASGSGRESRYSSPIDLLNQLANYIRQNDITNSLSGNGSSSSDGGSGPFRLVDTSYKGSQTSPTDLLSGLPTPPGLPSPSDLLSGLPTPPGLPSPSDLLASLPTPPGLPSPKNLFDKLPNPFKLFG